MSEKILKTLTTILAFRPIVYFFAGLLYVITFIGSHDAMLSSDMDLYRNLTIYFLVSSIVWVPVSVVNIVMNIISVKTMNDTYRESGLAKLPVSKWTIMIITSLVNFVLLSISLVPTYFLHRVLGLWIFTTLILIVFVVVNAFNIAMLIHSKKA